MDTNFRLVSLFLAASTAFATAHAQEPMRVAQTSPALNTSIKTFVAHSTHCELFLGHDGYVNENASRDYAEALARVLNVPNVTSADAFAQLNQACRTNRSQLRAASGR